MQITFDLAINELKNNDNFLILTHKNPDGDTLGSAVALCLSLRALGKVAFIMQNSGITPRFEEMTSPLIADDSFNPSYVIAVDIAAPDMIARSCLKYADCVNLAIDHHISHREFAEKTYVEGDSAACGEIIWEVVRALNVSPTPEIAKASYIAISTDTSCFLNSNTTARTHKIASELYSFDIDFDSIHRTFFVEKSRARIKIEAILIAGMNFYLDGQVAVMRLNENDIKEAGATEDDLDNISSLARSIEGVELGILVRQMGDVCKISMRSSDKFNASEICSLFGGGGHVRAAGATIEGSPTEVEKKIVSALEKK